MRWVLVIVGILLVLVGALWVLQGTNVLTQGGMAGHSQWTVIGAILAAVGIVLIVWGANRRRAKRA
jgi:multisubunit Na+/H+ antiporter MnhG subunit